MDIHITIMEKKIDKYKNALRNLDDRIIAMAAGSLHDTIEDTDATFSYIESISNRRVAQVVLAVTDVPEENRLYLHLGTMLKTVKDHIALFDKMCDLMANGEYSKENGSSMYKKYLEEYEYRRPIFKIAIRKYPHYFDMKVIDEMWKELDDIFLT